MEAQSILNFEVINVPGRERIKHSELAKKFREHFARTIDNHPERRIHTMFQSDSIGRSTTKNSTTYTLELNYPRGGIEKNPKAKDKINHIISESLKEHRKEHPHLIIESHDVEIGVRTVTHKFTIKPNPAFKDKK